MTVFAIGVGLEGSNTRTQIRDMVNVPENAIFPDSYQVQQFVRRFCPGICSVLLCKIYLMTPNEELLELYTASQKRTGMRTSK